MVGFWFLIFSWNRYSVIPLQHSLQSSGSVTIIPNVKWIGPCYPMGPQSVFSNRINLLDFFHIQVFLLRPFRNEVDKLWKYTLLFFTKTSIVKAKMCHLNRTDVRCWSIFADWCEKKNNAILHKDNNCESWHWKSWTQTEGEQMSDAGRSIVDIVEKCKQNTTPCSFKAWNDPQVTKMQFIQKWSIILRCNVSRELIECLDLFLHWYMSQNASVFITELPNWLWNQISHELSKRRTPLLCPCKKQTMVMQTAHTDFALQGNKWLCKLAWRSLLSNGQRNTHISTLTCNKRQPFPFLHKNQICCFEVGEHE